MNEARVTHSCLLINKEVFVVGGIGRKTVEIFNLQNETWRSGPDLPKELAYSQLVKAKPSSQYSAFLIGGWRIQSGGYAVSDIFALTKNYKSFIKIGDLKTARYSHVALVLSEHVGEKCVA